MNAPDTIYLYDTEGDRSLALGEYHEERESKYDIPYDRRKTCRWWYRDDIGVHQRECDGVVGRYDEREQWCGGCGGRIELEE